MSLSRLQRCAKVMIHRGEENEIGVAEDRACLSNALREEAHLQSSHPRPTPLSKTVVFSGPLVYPIPLTPTIVEQCLSSDLCFAPLNEGSLYKRNQHV